MYLTLHFLWRIERAEKKIILNLTRNRAKEVQSLDTTEALQFQDNQLAQSKTGDIDQQ